MEEVILSLGSNMGDRAGNLRRAVALIGEGAGTVAAVSSVYETEPWGFSADTPFYNMAAIVQTTLAPPEFLAVLLAIEEKLGRVREPGAERYTSRPIDIDILFFGDQIIDTEGLTVPHPRLHERMFVLAPLNEIAPEKVHPVLNRSIRDVFKDCNDD
jgi:2-amino-4-hydroxy-6-hydroxymethyldihydropteridine diphosphokinase